MDELTIINDVIIGKNDYLYLAQGSQRVLDYITGKKNIKPDSILSFIFNIKNRSNICRLSNIKYKHFVMPDKQSGAPQYFPIKNYKLLGSEYKQHCDFEYPLDLIRGFGPNFYFKTDTHFSVYGEILISLHIASFFLEVKNEYKAELLSATSIKGTVCGDLGKKLKEKPTEDKLCIDHTWEFDYFSNQITAGNDGMIELYMSRSPRAKGRLLVFGDSFIKVCLHVLTFFFKEILFCRTRFFHPEIVVANRPDYIITQNVERYLGHVLSDSHAGNFILTPMLKGREHGFDYKNVTAINAALSYKSINYKRFSQQYY